MQSTPEGGRRRRPQLLWRQPSGGWEDEWLNQVNEILLKHSNSKLSFGNEGGGTSTGLSCHFRHSLFLHCFNTLFIFLLEPMGVQQRRALASRFTRGNKGGAIVPVLKGARSDGRRLRACLAAKKI